MSERLWFPLDRMLALADHAAAALRHQATTPEQPQYESPGAAVLIVLLDRGIAFTARPQHADDPLPWTSDTVHADGYDPHDATRQPRTGISTPDRGLPIPLTEPDTAGRTFPDDLRANAAHGARWLVIDVGHPDRISVYTRATREGYPHSAATWIAAHVEIPGVLGPYDAVVADGWTWNGFAIPRFTPEVAVQIAADSARATRHAPEDPLIRVQIQIVSHAGTPDEHTDTIDADKEGLFPIGAFAWAWERRDSDPASPTTPPSTSTAASAPDACTGRERAACVCPECNTCGQGLGARHDLGCPWQEGSQPHESPTIAAQATVLPEHTHRPGCPQVRRRPGHLFVALNDTDEQCGNCGAVNTCDADTIDSFGGTTEYHQRCTACGQTWSYLDISAVL